MKKSKWLDCQGNEFFPKQKGDSITGQDRAQKHCDFRFSQIEKKSKVAVLQLGTQVKSGHEKSENRDQLKKVLFGIQFLAHQGISILAQKINQNDCYLVRSKFMKKFGEAPPPPPPHNERGPLLLPFLCPPPTLPSAFISFLHWTKYMTKGLMALLLKINFVISS